MNSKKIFIVLLIMLIGMAGWLYLNKNNIFLEDSPLKSEDTATQEKDIDGDWLTYSSEIFKLEFKYPDYLQVEKIATGQNIIQETTMNQEVTLVIRKNNEEEQRVFVVAVIEPDMFEHAKLYSRDERVVKIDGKEAFQMKKDNMSDEAAFDFFTQTLVEFPNFFYLFLSEGESPLYYEILESVRFVE